MSMTEDLKCCGGCGLWGLKPFWAACNVYFISAQETPTIMDSSVALILYGLESPTMNIHITHTHTHTCL